MAKILVPPRNCAIVLIREILVLNVTLGHRPEVSLELGNSNWPNSIFTLRQCSIYDAQLRTTTRAFAQWNVIRVHLQRSRFHIVYMLHRSFNAWNASLFVRLHGCAIACALKQTFPQCKIFSEGTLLSRYSESNVIMKSHLDSISSRQWVVCASVILLFRFFRSLVVSRSTPSSQ